MKWSVMSGANDAVGSRGELNVVSKGMEKSSSALSLGRKKRRLPCVFCICEYSVSKTCGLSGVQC